MRKLFLFLCIPFYFASCNTSPPLEEVQPEHITLSKDVLFDKIRGGWAGQTIGCTYGGPTEFKFKGTMIQDYQQMVWYDDYISET